MSNTIKDEAIGSFLVAAKAGVKNAADALRVMSSSAVNMDVVSAGMASTSSLAEITGDPEDMVVGVYVAVNGEMPGHSLLVFTYDSALQLADLMMGQPLGTTTEINDMAQSVVQEVGNIVTSSYLNSFSDFYGRALLPTPPSLAVDMAAAVISSVLLNAGQCDEDTISVVTRFDGGNHSLRGFFLYIPEIAIQASA